MFSGKKYQIKGRISGLDVAVCSRWRLGALLVAGVMASGALLIEAASAGPESPMRVMTEDLTKALGPTVISVTAVDDTGNEVLYLRSDVYEQVSQVNYSTPVNFPVEPVSRILAVNGVPGSTEGRVLIVYDASPATALDCKWVGTIYRCYSN